MAFVFGMFPSLKPCAGAHAFGLVNMTIIDTLETAMANGAPEAALDNQYLKAVIDTATGTSPRACMRAQMLVLCGPLRKKGRKEEIW